MISEEIQKHFPALAKYRNLEDEIIRLSEVHTFEKGSVILREGQYIKVLPLLVKGLVKVYHEDDQDGEVLLYYIKPGESCVMSMTSLVGGQKSPVKGVVEEDAEIVVIPADGAMELARTHVAWNAFMYDLFREKYNELLHTISVLTFSNKDQLVLDHLKNIAELKGEKVIHKTHAEIAQDLGSTREVISRLLKKLEHQGVLRLKLGVIELL